MKSTEIYNRFEFNVYRHRKGYTKVFDPPGLPRHYIAHVIRGSVRITVGRKSFSAGAGDVIYYPTGAVYRAVWTPDESGEILFYSFGFRFFPDNTNTFFPLQKAEINDSARAFLAEAEEDISVSPLTVGKFYRFFGECAPSLSAGKSAAGDEVVRAAETLLREDPMKSAGEIARGVGISEPGLYLHFRRRLGKTPSALRREIIAEKTSELLLTTDMTLEEISGRLGVSSASYLRKIFVSVTGTTPSVYRRTERGSGI